MREWIKAILVLPFNVTIVIPLIILFICEYEYTYSGAVFLIIGVSFLILGAFLAIWAMILFQRIGRGTLAPWAATKKLVIEGPYKYVRNPMIIGVLLILTGEAFILNTRFIFYWMLTFFIINCIYFKLFEEKQLEKNFGVEYLEYKKNVPMWFPKLK